MYNVDETGLSMAQNKITKEIVLKGKNKIYRQIADVTSAERWATITIIERESALGHYVSPMIIFHERLS